MNLVARAKQWFVADWKTNSSGLLLLAIAVLEWNGVQVAGVTATPGVLVIQAAVAFGLISAKDAGK